MKLIDLLKIKPRKCLIIYCCVILVIVIILLPLEETVILRSINCAMIEHQNDEIILNGSEKPIFPFTYRVSANDYINNSKSVWSFSGKIESNEEYHKLITLDEDGIPITNYSLSYDGASYQYNSNFIAIYALAIYRDYLNNNDSFLLEDFKKQVKWYLDHKKQKYYDNLEFWVWEYNFDNPKFNATAPWISALSQGRIMCVFLAAYDLTCDPIYLSAAEKTYHSFLVPASEGGVTTFDGDIAWYEEVADENAPSSKILNGHITALQGLWTYWKWTGRKDVKEYLDMGVKAVTNQISNYDAEVLSYYSQYPLKPRIFAPSGDYNSFHVHQLIWLFDITGKELFLDYALKFASYDTRKWNITTAGSTDPIHHGPDNLFFEMGTKFWSHNTFPTWIQIDLDEKDMINGVVLFGYTNTSTPKDYKIFTSSDGNLWNCVSNISDNHEPFIKEQFEPTFARFVKIIIDNDNGNKNVALTGVAILKEEPYRSAISDWNSYDSSNLPDSIFKDGWKIPNNGWIIVDFGKKEKSIIMELIGEDNGGTYSINFANRIKDLFNEGSPLKQTMKEDQKIIIDNFNSRYIKIDFDRCEGINNDAKHSSNVIRIR